MRIFAVAFVLSFIAGLEARAVFPESGNLGVNQDTDLEENLDADLQAKNPCNPGKYSVIKPKCCVI